jgi:cellulose biosynthesis protein BcsQ
LLTLNALCAADGVLVPLQCEYYALEGLSDLQATVNLVGRSLNPGLDIEGILLCMVDTRQNLTEQVADRSAQPLRRPRVPHAHPTQRAPVRGAVVWQADSAL